MLYEPHVFPAFIKASLFFIVQVSCIGWHCPGLLYNIFNNLFFCHQVCHRVCERVFMGCVDCICSDFICGDFICSDCICGEMHSMCMSWCSELTNALAVRICFRYISCPFSDHSDSMQDTAGGSLTRTRTRPRWTSVSVSAMFVMWLISVVS